MKKISKIITLLVLLIVGILAVGCQSQEEIEADIQASTPDVFPSFTAKDFEGKTYSQEFFKENKATVVNLWFTGCTPCADEMPLLEEKRKERKEKDVELIGICTDGIAAEDNQEAKDLLSSLGVTYPNLTMDSSEDIDNYLNGLMAFPTTLVIDSNGKVVGDAVIGGLTEAESMKTLEANIDLAINGAE